jgi:hypothetical protein
MQTTSNVQSSPATVSRAPFLIGNAGGASSIAMIAIILAHGVVRLHQRQRQLDFLSDKSVHHVTLTTIEETL